MHHHTVVPKKISMFYPALVISLCAAFQFYKYVLQIYPSIITDQLMREFQLTGAGLGNLAATFYYTFMIVQLFVGVLLDRFGTRVIASLAILSCALGVLCFSQAHHVWAAWVCRGLIGAGVAFSTVTYLKLAAVWFTTKRYAFVNGLLATATMAGAIFGQIPLSALIHHSGWRACLLMVGLVGFVLAVLFFLMVRDTPTVAADTVHTNKKSSDWFKELTQVLKNKQNWLLAGYGGLAFSPISVFGGLWGNPFLQQAYHLDQPHASFMISLIFLGLGLGSPLIGLLSGYLGDRRNIMFYCTLLSGLSLSLVIYVHALPLWAVGSLLFIFGFTLGAFLLAFVLGKELNSASVTATVVAMINAGDAILTGMTEPAIGKLLDLGWDGSIINGAHHFSLHSYHLALAVLPVYMIIASLLLLRIKHTKEQTSVYQSAYRACSEVRY